MFEIKELLEGVVETTIQLPITFLRSHAVFLSHGSAGPFILARRQKRQSREYLQPTSLAFIEILVLYAMSKAIAAYRGNQGFIPFTNNWFAEILKLKDVDLYDQQLVGLFGLLLAFYYSAYVLLSPLRLKRRVRVVMIDTCLYYFMMSVFLAGIFVGLFLGAHNAAFTGRNEFILRVVLGFIYGSSSIALGRFLARVTARSSTTGRVWLRTTLFSIAALTVFAAIFAAVFGKDGLWPNLRA